MSIPFYLFKGPEFGEKNDEIQILKTNCKKKYPSAEFSTFYANETEISEILSQLSNGSLFSDARFFVVKNAEEIKKKEDIQLIENWAKACQEQKLDDSVLVLVTDENKADAKIEKLVPKENNKIFYEMFDNRKIPWIKDYFSKNGFKIYEDAAQSILDMIENNTEALKNECSRFFTCFTADHVISVDDVEKILAHNKEENAFTLFNALSNSDNNPSKRLEDSLEILLKISEANSKSSNFSITLLAGLLYSFRQLKKWHMLFQTSQTSEAELKSNGFYTKASQTQYRKASSLWNAVQTQRIIALLSSVDMQIRTNGTSMQNQLLQTMLYQIVMKNGSKMCEYEKN